jgi:hypothetical protein
MRIETRCRITGVDNPIHLLASHCKPWRDTGMSKPRTRSRTRKPMLPT